MWWVLCFPDCQLPWLVLSNFAYLSYLELNAWHRPDSWYWHRCADLLRCVRSALLTTPAKPAVTVVVYGKPQAFWCLPLAQPRVIFVYLMMDQDCMPSWEPWANGTNAYSAVANSEWHKNKVISFTCVRSLCCFWTFPFDIVTLHWFKLGAAECGHFTSHAIFHADNVSRELLMLCLCFQCRGAALRGDSPVVVDALSHPPVMAVYCRGSDTRHQCLGFDSVEFAQLASFLTPRTPLNREGALLLRLRLRRIPSKSWLYYTHIGGWWSIHSAKRTYISLT